MLGVFGASLFFGDSMLTPAISVLSAVEGLEVVAPQLHSWIVPIALLILVSLFATQRFGTEKVGKVFGPVTSVWFVSIAAIGVLNIVHEPEVLQALNPWWALQFFVQHGWHAIFVLGAVVLAVTGGGHPDPAGATSAMPPQRPAPSPPPRRRACAGLPPPPPRHLWPQTPFLFR